MLNVYRDKLILCIWLEQLGLVFHKLLKSNHMITEALFRTQFIKTRLLLLQMIMHVTTPVKT